MLGLAQQQYVDDRGPVELVQLGKLIPEPEYGGAIIPEYTPASNQRRTSPMMKGRVLYITPDVIFLYTGGDGHGRDGQRPKRFRLGQLFGDIPTGSLGLLQQLSAVGQVGDCQAMGKHTRSP
jgi:hypothetical protein